MKIAIFGGSFNPIHNGHIVGVQKVFDSGLFDKVWIMPSKIPPFKQHQYNSITHRLAFCEMVAKQLPFLEVSRFEMEREKVSYTYDTLVALKAMYPEDEFCWVIGYDQVINIHAWYESENLLRDFDFVVLNRGGFQVASAQSAMDRLTEAYGTDFIQVSMPNIEMSSTELRQRVHKGQSLIGYTLSEISQYIGEHELYQEVEHVR
jgi:nicotinate-nucleotide adenylyltransferase